LAATSSLNPTASIALWVGVAILVALLGSLVASRLRAWARRVDAPAMFTLQDLREMRASGQITPEEFERMRAALLGRLTDTAAPPESDSPGQASTEPDAGP
jgi:hypothetical protein